MGIRNSVVGSRLVGSLVTQWMSRNTPAKRRSAQSSPECRGGGEGSETIEDCELRYAMYVASRRKEGDSSRAATGEKSKTASRETWSRSVELQSPFGVWRSSGWMDGQVWLQRSGCSRAAPGPGRGFYLQKDSPKLQAPEFQGFGGAARSSDLGAGTALCAPATLNPPPPPGPLHLFLHM